MAASRHLVLCAICASLSAWSCAVNDGHGSETRVTAVPDSLPSDGPAAVAMERPAAALEPPAGVRPEISLASAAEEESESPERPGVADARPYARSVDPVDPDRALVSTSKVTPVYREPSFEARKIGYLRAGAIVRRSAEPVGFEGCTQGFYEIVPEGYVCVGRAASIDPEHPLVEAVARRADRTKGLPYLYGMAPLPGAPFYTRIPSAEEQARAELDIEWHLAHPLGTGFGDLDFDDVPPFLRGGKPGISVHGYPHPKDKPFLRHAIANSGYAFVSWFESGGRRWGLTVDMTLIPLDRLRAVTPSRFHGLPLGASAALPVVFVRAKGQVLYKGRPGETGLAFERMIEFREAFPITGKTARVGKDRYLETRSGHWLRDRHVVRIDPMKNVPRWATPGRTWIDVSILKQSLVAYEGVEPLFVTLVSTGIDGIQDHEETHATIQGQFLVHTKHVSVTMSSDEVGDEFDLREVPYVQYFSDGYALHAAYWHDGFGTPRSHGCVNLSPLDARWLFGWSDPPVPSAWHGAMSLRDGTLVSIHP